jgi:hypothetical protein
MTRLGPSRAALFLLSVGLFASALAEARPPVVIGGRYEHKPVYARGVSSWSGRATLSGTLIRSTTATTTWLLYPGACLDRANNVWSAKTSAIADSLDSYATGTADTYTAADRALSETLWHVVDTSTPSSQRPAILSGNKSLWCGKYDPSWAIKVGYPDVTYQILYVNTGPHSSSYNLTMNMNVSCELKYDFLYLIGGGAGGAADTLGNNRSYMDDIIGSGSGGPMGDSDLLVSWTGSISGSTPGATSINATSGTVRIEGATGAPSTIGTTITIPSDHRGLYFVLVTDDHNSSEDGLWPQGSGLVFDDLATSDNGSIYAEQVAAGGTDAFGGSVILGTPGAPVLSARVASSSNTNWVIHSGLEIPTSDACSPQKSSSTDHFFFGGDFATLLTVPGSFPSIVSCTFPIPAGTASLAAYWNEYLDLPRGSGYVQFAEYRFFKGGAWSDWRGTAASNARHAGGNQTWAVNGDYLAEAAQADSIQLRWNLQCVPGYALDKVHCQPVDRGLLYDDLRLEATSGTPYPTFGIFVGGVAQSTFVDGTIHGTNCSSTPCWPGIRGTDLGAPVGINDNFNSPIGDSITIDCMSSLRQNGMGINWLHGFDKSVAGGLTITHTNASYNPAFDQPRMIYRLFDPLTKTWSPFDSTALDADAVVATPADTNVIRSGFRVDWPPRDKIGFNLPGGFTINGVGAYSSLSFLPHGTRIQYYFKVVDILGVTAYQFSSDFAGLEVTDLPTLPGGSAKAPDIIQFEVLPGVYPSGSGGTLLAGRTNTPLLNLDGAYSNWSFTQDPVTQALRGLGVRADRYRYLQGYESGSNFGGHEIAGHRIARESNYFPNYLEYPLVDSLASWYRILIQSSHLINFPVFDEQDAIVAEQWMRKDSGPNQGDRCLFGSGDDFFNTLLNGPGSTSAHLSLATNVFGVAASTSPTLATFPTIDDRFAAASAGPALAPPLTYTYPIDGSCPGYNRFDVLSKVGSTDAQNTAFYPVASQIGGIARMSENDLVVDNDRSKAIGYGFSIQFIRQAGYPASSAVVPASSGLRPAMTAINPSYDHTGVENRMRVLYKFLTSCRGTRTPAPGDTGKCWPCPSPGTTLGLMQANWALQGAGFMTSTYGPLYPIQDNATVTAVEEPSPELTPAVDALEQNRPNPFNPETVIPYSLGHPGKVAIRIYDVAGRCVRTLVDGAQPAGLHVVRWNGKTDSGDQAASGVYFYQIRYPNGGAQSKKLMILR